MSDKKLEYWKHQLLDLGKRNKMINYRETKRTTIKLVEPSFDELFNRLAVHEETLTFQRSVDRETDIRVFSVLSLLENLSASLPVTIGDIKTEGSILERQRTLKNLRAKSKLAQEEQGVHILYLSFGFVEWKDGASSQWIKSPLILVPVVLTLEALNSPYTLKKHEDDIVVNPTFEYYLKSEYGIELPPFDDDKDTLDDYLKSLEEIADQRGWRILREVSLGLLSFLKISMYNDLTRNEERIKKHPVIRAMLGDAAEANEIPERLCNFDLDSISTQDCYQVLSADSSQQDAILYSKNNISFVMQGPPGTGKSQTIANIIAEALAEDKKVLFVSEKMAALQVVYRRLQEVHLGDFCLPLHSYKANKKEILEQIGANLDLKRFPVKDEAISKLEELLSIRRELNEYAKELHALQPELHISCYEAYSKLEEIRDAPAVSFAFGDPLNVSQTQLQSYLNALKSYSLSLERLHYFVNGNPWDGLSARASGYEYTERMRTELTALTRSINECIEILATIRESSEVCERSPYVSIPAITEYMENICGLPQIPEIWLGAFDFERSVQSATDAQNAYAKLFALRETIAKVFVDAIYRYPYNEWKETLSAQATALFELPFIRGKDAAFFVQEVGVLRARFSRLRNALTDAKNFHAAINEKLGTDFSINAYDRQTIVSLSGLIRRNVILRKIWFDSDIGKLRTLVAEAQTVVSDMKSAQEKLLAVWEPEILGLDYEPILLRYKTEYTNIFKIFKGQYKRDRRQILAFSKTVLKKLSDDTVVELLTTLKIYRDKLRWLEEHAPELESLLGEFYRGVDSDWDSIVRAVEFCAQIRNLPIGEITSRLLDLVSVEHAEEAAKLDALLSELTKAWASAKNEIASLEAEIDLDSADFDMEKTLETVDAYLCKLDEASAQIEMIKPYLVHPNETIDAISQAIETLNSYREAECLVHIRIPKKEAPPRGAS